MRQSRKKKLSTRNDLTIFGTCSLKLLDQFTDQKKTVKEHLRECLCKSGPVDFA